MDVATTDEITVTTRTTIEDLLNFKKVELSSFLRRRNFKVSGSKRQLAERIVAEIVAQIRENTDASDGTQEEGTNNLQDETDITNINNLKAGWCGTKDAIFPKITIKDVERYLLHSSHRTMDKRKMECYRQYIRGLNFFKEGYIHKLMVNNISSDSKLCYVRSKCFPSMKKGTYEQWILVSKEAPFRIQKAHCSCPAGLGEGCTHIAGLLFALEGKETIEENVPCTSQPCQWNKPSKRVKETRPVEQISFKRIKYGEKVTAEKVEKERNKFKIDKTKFRASLTTNLGNDSKAALFCLLPNVEQKVKVESDLNVSNFEEVETSEHVSNISDPYINLISTIEQEQMTREDFQGFLTQCTQEVANEIEFRTRGQHSNPLWVSARKCRVTASIFHDIKTRKDSTCPDKLVEKIFGETKSFDNEALAWGRKQEMVAKKRYKAHMKLKQKKNVKVLEKGLVVCTSWSYVGASPDGVVSSEERTVLLEIKCPYKWRKSKILDACKDDDFYCTSDENGNISLKSNHRYFTQVQGQMGVCNIDLCHFVVHTLEDFVVIPVKYDQIFWQELLEKIKLFYTTYVVSKLPLK